MKRLIEEVKACQACDGLPLGPRPIFQISSNSKILIAGQAPGRVTHTKGIPFDDASGNRLREWLGVDDSQFYDANNFAIVPMGFCFPGSGKSGDLPPTERCAQLWREKLLEQARQIELTVVIGRYALDWHLPETKRQNVTDIVRDWRNHLPRQMVLPHPSPRNNIWLSKNPWFNQDVLAALQARVQQVLS